jgi:general secretion pathway protein E/type IV pilus assembly protein PilB
LINGLSMDNPPTEHRVAVGCSNCHFTGYKGRHAVYEVVAMDNGLQELLRTGQTNAAAALRERGIRDLAHSALELLRAGRTSLEEVYPVLSSH